VKVARIKVRNLERSAEDCRENKMKVFLREVIEEKKFQQKKKEIEKNTILCYQITI